MEGGLLIGLYGTVTVWIISAFLAIFMGLLFTVGILNKTHIIQVSVRWLINFSRGIPTSIYVILGGLLVIKGHSALSLPAIFPGTLDGFEPVAWAITFALAFGSAGHLAEIFVASYVSMDKARLEQLTVMGFSGIHKFMIAARECAYIAIPPTSTRMIHHLHNTAFASLFPVVELFGNIQTSASTSFKVFEITVIGCGLYILLSGSIWLVFRVFEALLSPQRGFNIFSVTRLGQ